MPKRDFPIPCYCLAGIYAMTTFTLCMVVLFRTLQIELLIDNTRVP